MKQRKGSKRALVLLCLLAFAAIVAGCGSSTETMPKATGVLLSSSTPTAGLSSCTGCHTDVAADWLTTRHANIESNPTPTTNTFCLRCHDQLGDSQQLATARMVVGCESCHGPGSLHAEAGGVGPISLISNTTGSVVLGSAATATVSGQFVMCTACHNLLSYDTGTLNLSPMHSSPTPEYELMITDTHYATVPASYSTTTTITGYAMDFSSETVCSNCHNPHGTADINRDWAASGHADMTATPWTRNWSLSSNQFCQRCHTTTGFTNYANANASGDTTTVSNIWNGLVSNFTSTFWKPEMLECSGCHINNRGALRSPGAYNATYGFRTGTPISKIYAYATHQYPDVSSSNLCILCHSGRNSGETIHLLNTAQAGTTATVNFGAIGVSTPHDMTAAGTTLRSVGYEYDGRSYTDPASYLHVKIGTSAVPNTGTGGPCVGCHMYRTDQSANHLFSAVSKSGDTVTTVSSEVCFICHAGSSSGLAKIVDDERVAFDEALQALDWQLRVVSLVTGTPYPSGSNTSNWLVAGDTDITGNTWGKKYMGAAFNRSFLMNEHGAYIHNSKYTKRLIYDSIDWVDNHNLDYSVGQTLNAICSSGTPSTWCPLGKDYILPSGVRPGAAAERPY